ncbi:MAG: tRNA (adenosine(37)-N6)-threonylcarbamoyltransferase complex dimerization subunit type 1 TsaB [Dysgonamonadaceae bacterium]
MSILLSIETATEACSCALTKDGEVIINKEDDKGRTHSSSLGLFVSEILEFARDNKLNPNAIVVSSGPGSYTGLRIGVSEAKGLSYGLDIPLIAIPTPKIMAWIVKNKVDSNTLLCPMIDARRMEVYSTFYDTSLNVVRETSADIVNEESYADLLVDHQVVFFGNGAEKCKKELTHHNAHFLSNVIPLASAMHALGEEAFTQKDFVDVAYFEPFYLKEFVATVPKNKLFNV